MKRSALIRDLIKSGCRLKRHAGRHDIHANSRSARQAPIPRHAEIKESLVRLIRKQLGL